MHSAYLGSENYHKILGLEYDATPDEIKRAYRQLAKKYHPDINPLPDAHNLFIEITEAYEILINRNLHHLYVEEDTATDRETRRAEYEKARQAARESAQRYARMKYEKFRQEQEAFKKSGWHDLILTFRYFIRILLFPLIAFFIAMPLINEAVAEHPSGLVMMWLLASILILFVANNWKSYFNLDPYYYSLADINKLIRDSARITGGRTENQSGYFSLKRRLYLIKRQPYFSRPGPPGTLAAGKPSYTGDRILNGRLPVVVA